MSHFFEEFCLPKNLIRFRITENPGSLASAVNGLLSDNKTEGNTGKQRETDQQKTDQDTINTDQRFIDINPEKESKKESKRGGGGQQDSAELDT